MNHQANSPGRRCRECASEAPSTLKVGELKTFNQQLNAYLAKRGLTQHPYRSSKSKGK